ncbi:hypothetical protein Hypma_003823 [Hypsizygus marmoreus]|uniref:Uncharacterized protein n=1 Tax=Hypsizygus marmoreus TaxID=39966 RepID=A0A369K0U0_HYPMA|nr:hypothetical protein Hypma_003823 [Hypsizygus marmoreus]
MSLRCPLKVPDLLVLYPACSVARPHILLRMSGNVEKAAPYIFLLALRHLTVVASTVGSMEVLSNLGGLIKAMILLGSLTAIAPEVPFYIGKLPQFNRLRKRHRIGAAFNE